MPGDEDKSQKQSRFHSIRTGQFISAYEIRPSDINTCFIDNINTNIYVMGVNFIIIIIIIVIDGFGCLGYYVSMLEALMLLAKLPVPRMG